MSVPDSVMTGVRALTDLPVEAWVPLTAALVLVTVVGSWLGWRVARAAVRRRLAHHRSLGVVGERRGLVLLRKAGYRILEVQAVGGYRLWVDGRWVRFDCRADAIVARGRRRYVAEFKADELNATINYRATRRQLLEYWLAFDADALLLVDVGRQDISEVRPPRKVPPPRRGWGWRLRGSPAPRA